MTPFDSSRYRCQIVLPELGPEGQRALSKATVAICGRGGLGAPAALYLAATGIGRLILIDDDRVEISNLQRQIIYDENAINQPKAEMAAARLEQQSSLVDIDCCVVRLTSSNAGDLLASASVVIDATDNIQGRRAINAACHELGISWIYCGLHRFQSQVAVFDFGNGQSPDCYECLFPSQNDSVDPPDCADSGVIGAFAGLVGCMQALEAIKVIVGMHSPLVDHLLVFDGRQYETARIKRKPHADCRICTLQIESQSKQKRQVATGHRELDPRTLHDWLADEQPCLLLDVREPDERAAMRFAADINLPLSLISSHPQDQAVSDLTSGSSSPIVVYCRSGQRSLLALDVLQRLLRMQNRPLYNLTGGILAWYRHFADEYLG